MANPVEVTDNSFEQDVLQADTPVLVVTGPTGAARASRWRRSSTPWPTSTRVA